MFLSIYPAPRLVFGCALVFIVYLALLGGGCDGPPPSEHAQEQSLPEKDGSATPDQISSLDQLPDIRRSDVGRTESTPQEQIQEQKSPPEPPPQETQRPDTPAPCTSTGFAKTPVTWSLPYALIRQDGRNFSQIGNNYHSLVDLNGDGKLDFVLVRDEERESGKDPLVGKNHWLIFKNTGSGFAKTPVTWSLPYALIRQDGRNFSQIGNNYHSLIDIDGDGKPDFVLVRDEERESGARDPLVGKNHWLVFKNTGNGFSKTPVKWSLPYALIRQDGRNFSQFGNNYHSLVDIDGDGKIDFVLARDEERESGKDPLVGKNHWLIFKNTGSGFAKTPVTWSLPYALIRQDGRNFSQIGNNYHSLMDLDGDGKIDFVLVRDEERESGKDPLVGKNHWLIFKNTGSGFAKTPVTWSLPYALIRQDGRNFSQIGNNYHSLLSMDRSRKPDFVLVRDEERESGKDPLVGKNHWLIFKNTGSGFAKTPVTWSLPYALIRQDGRNFSQFGNNYHSLLDMNANRKLDFVLVRDEERESGKDPLVGKNHWLRFPSTCP